MSSGHQLSFFCLMLCRQKWYFILIAHVWANVSVHESIQTEANGLSQVCTFVSNNNNNKFHLVLWNTLKCFSLDSCELLHKNKVSNEKKEMASPQDIIISIGLNCQYNLLISFSVVRMTNAESEERKERTKERARTAYKN